MSIIQDWSCQPCIQYGNEFDICGFYQRVNTRNSLKKWTKHKNQSHFLYFQRIHVYIRNASYMAYLSNMHKENSSKILAQWIYGSINAALNLLSTNQIALKHVHLLSWNYSKLFRTVWIRDSLQQQKKYILQVILSHQSDS